MPFHIYQALVAYTLHGDRMAWIPHWLHDDYEEFLVRYYRYVQLDGYNMLNFQGISLRPLHPLLSVAPGL